MNPLLRRLDATIHRTIWPLTAAARVFAAEYRRLRAEQADNRRGRHMMTPTEAGHALLAPLPAGISTDEADAEMARRQAACADAHERWAQTVNSTGPHLHFEPHANALDADQ